MDDWTATLRLRALRLGRLIELQAPPPVLAAEVVLVLAAAARAIPAALSEAIDRDNPVDLEPDQH